MKRGYNVTRYAKPAMEPIHPGEILAEEYLAPLGVTQHRLAVAIGVPPRRINEIVHRTRRISANTALRLARYFGTSERFWINLQSRYDLEVERDRIGPVLAEIRPLRSA
jgi:antitoxin HigA-1